jgi:hypothetical protein
VHDVEVSLNEYVPYNLDVFHQVNLSPPDAYIQISQEGEGVPIFFENISLIVDSLERGAGILCLASKKTLNDLSGMEYCSPQIRKSLNFHKTDLSKVNEIFL